MAWAGKLTALIAGLGCLALVGCSDLEGFLPEAFVSAPTSHKVRARLHPMIRHFVKTTTQADVPETEIVKCQQKLYHQAAESLQDLRSAEDKCRELIVNQGY